MIQRQSVVGMWPPTRISDWTKGTMPPTMGTKGTHDHQQDCHYQQRKESIINNHYNRWFHISTTSPILVKSTPLANQAIGGRSAQLVSWPHPAIPVGYGLLAIKLLVAKLVLEFYSASAGVTKLLQNQHFPKKTSVFGHPKTAKNAGFLSVLGPTSCEVWLSSTPTLGHFLPCINVHSHHLMATLWGGGPVECFGNGCRRPRVPQENVEIFPFSRRSLGTVS